eukprot:PhF_6_TR6818/c0_g1_i1/m.9808/K09514/DNAJB8; DnaJ homolog subfamily B member 8
MAEGPVGDLYAELGVKRTATLEEIRLAYKRLALQYHPDRNPDNVHGAQAKFKKVSHAYSVLSDPKQRAAYDNPQPQWGGGGGPAGFPGGGRGFATTQQMSQEDLEDLLRHMFGGDPFRQQRATHFQQPRNPRHRQNVINIPPLLILFVIFFLFSGVGAALILPLLNIGIFVLLLYFGTKILANA